MERLHHLAMVLTVLGQVTALNFSLAGFNFGGSSSKLPYLDPEEWWGPPQLRGQQDTNIRPFQIRFDEQLIQDLRNRLRNHRPFTPPLQGVGFRYGFNSEIIEEWLQYWAEQYPFAERERFLNQFPMFKTNIQGLDIQFIRVRPQVPPGVEVVPLLMMHGWPGSIREFYECIPLITRYPNGKDFAVEVVVPALPGYGYSDGTYRTGLGGSQIGVIMRNLMRRLGHPQFYIQAGDIGGITAGYMATLYPQDVLGFHTNMATALAPAALFIQVLGALDPPLVVDPALADRMYPLREKTEFLIEESGYLHEQATKPDTVGIALSDSPAGLLAYILEKFSVGTGGAPARDLRDGGISNFDKDQIIDNLMLYWAPNSMTTAMRFYAETFNKKHFAMGLESIPTPVPTWAIQSKFELYQSPTILRVKYPNLINATVLDFGGHFLAFEQPEVLVVDVLEALTAFRRWHRTNNGPGQSLLDNSIRRNSDSLTRTSQELLQRVRGNADLIPAAAAQWIDAYMRHAGHSWMTFMGYD